MTHVTGNVPDGTPNWLDIGVPDLDRAKTFYGSSSAGGSRTRGRRAATTTCAPCAASPSPG